MTSNEFILVGMVVGVFGAFVVARWALLGEASVKILVRGWGILVALLLFLQLYWQVTAVRLIDVELVFISLGVCIGMPFAGLLLAGMGE